MTKTKCICLAFALTGGLSSFSPASSLPAISGSRMILALPARQRIVQLGFDVLSIRPQLLLLTYQGAADDPEAGMHIWNGREWLRLSDADYEAGRFLRSDTVIRQMYLVGTGSEVPWVLQYCPAWAEGMNWIQSLQASDLVNVLGDRFRFTREEWSWIAGLHDLRLFETTVKLRHVQREESRPVPTPEEARRPLLERVRRRPPPATVVPIVPQRVERQPWVEVPVEVPIDATPSEPLEMMPPKDIQEPPVATVIPGKTSDLQIIDAQPVAAPERTAAPAPVAAVPGPAIESDQQSVPDATAALSAPDAPAAMEDSDPTDPVEALPPVDPSATLGPADTSPADTLTPEERDFFDMIRNQFPDLDGLPELSP